MLERSPGKQPLVLVIDDDADIAASIGDVLSGGGYDVAIAASGVAAVESVLRRRPGLVLLDWRLPSEPCGGALVRKLRDACGAAVPIVVLSADPRSLAEAREAEASDYLPKPFHIADLLHVVDENCSD